MEDQRLIAAVRARSPIYDKWDKHHHNRLYLAKAWESIAQEVGSDAISCRNRWGTMRDYFVRKYRQAKPPNNGQSARKIKWHLYEHLAFLIPIYCQKESTEESGDVLNGTNVKTEVEDIVGEPSFSEAPFSEAAFSEAPSPSGCSISSEDFIDNAAVTFKMPDQQEADQSLACATPTTTSMTRSSGAGRKRPLAEEPPAKSSISSGACSSILSNMDLEVIKALRHVDPMDENEMFFKSLLPSLSRLDHIQTMEFRLEVQSLLLKYLRAPRRYPSPQEPESVPMTSHDLESTGGYVPPLYGGSANGVNEKQTDSIALHLQQLNDQITDSPNVGFTEHQAH